MSARERLQAAGTGLRDALKRRKARPHIDREEAAGIAPEAVEAAKAAIRFGARAAVLRADGNLSLADARELAPLAKDLGMETADVVALIDEAMAD